MRNLTQQEIDDAPEYGRFYRVAWDDDVNFISFLMADYKPVPGREAKPLAEQLANAPDYAEFYLLDPLDGDVLFSGVDNPDLGYKRIPGRDKGHGHEHNVEAFRLSRITNRKTILSDTLKLIMAIAFVGSLIAII